MVFGLIVASDYCSMAMPPLYNRPLTTTDRTGALLLYCAMYLGSKRVRRGYFSSATECSNT